MIRSLISMSLLGLFLFVGLTVPLGQRTLFGHVRNIWASEQAQEMVDGVKDSSAPLVDRVKRGVEAGFSDSRDSGPVETSDGNPDGTVVETPTPARPGAAR